MAVQDGLKNRGHTSADVEERRKAVEALTETDLTPITDYSFDPEKASKNIENMIGVTQ
ncbi:MAG: 3-hydroxy-3-methylglutaryl-CoA reductase, partial [Candidatus Methanomethylophilaceae archaeon]|nr:3-hydroxy-3-methylglutaryl-CoA reductase [Candidatus Methanomethylophilaceae archaeon]